ncbi:MAG TPA: metal ABC transporter substrate-binding protein [Aeromicrobium sp.]|nr:metal ABC transporter substrate-binding protein [Aeromicrobium sp.]
MKIKRPAVWLAAIIAAASLTSCSTTDNADGNSKPTVIASFYPAQFLAERIGGSTVQLSTLTSPGVEAHDLELTAKQVVALSEADVVVYLSDFQSAVDHAIEETTNETLTLVDIGAGVEREHEEHDHEDDGHDHDGDPHIWLAPENMITAAESVRDALIEANPDEKSLYEANAARLVTELEELDNAFEVGLEDAQCERREFITSHAAFGHLAQAYDLTQIPISGIDPQSEPSVAALAEITDLVTAEGFTTVFTEPLSSPALAKTIARQTGAKTAVLDPIEGLTDETADEDYLSLMGQNLAALTAANGCK